MGVSAVNAIGKALWKHKFSTIINGGFAINEFDESIKKGESTSDAVMGAAGDIALPILVGGWAYAGIMAAEMLPTAAVNAYEASTSYGSSIARSSNSTFSQANFMDNEQYQTMRQAGMAAIERSKYNEQLAMLGDEARFMHK